MRLFIAIEFDDNMKSVLTGLQEDMKNQGITGNYSKRENLHLTLVFIGEYDNPEKVLNVMDQVPLNEFPIEIEGVKRFDRNKELLWAGISENEALNDYVEQLRAALNKARIPCDKKKFFPHITLIRKAVYRNDDINFAKEVPRNKMTVKHVSLMKSERSENGVVYSEIFRSNTFVTK